MDLYIGMKGCLQTTVTDKNTAKALKSGELDVFATPALVALAEETAWKSVSECLEHNQSTVGTKINISHIAPTPIGMNVKCETELIEIDRRKLVFNVNVYDDKKQIAVGKHERFIVNIEKFLSKANEL